MNRVSYKAGVQLFSHKFIFVVLLILLPTLAQASIIGSIRSWFGGTPEPVKEMQGNSQTVPLLQGSYSPYSNLSRGGGEVVIVDDALSPDGTISSGQDGSVVRPKSDQISMYVVRPGDTLSDIAHMFGVSINTIMWANNLKSKTVKEGQTLIILPISGVRHTVKSGDTLQTIAKKYKGTVEDVEDYNNLEHGAPLSLGTVLIIPDGEVAAEPVSAKPFFGSAGSSGLPTYAGYFLRPIRGGIKTQGIHGFNGVDLGTSIGSPIYAAADGDVIISKNSGWNGGYGDYIVIAHPNGTQTLYAHLSSSIVSPGTKVTQGQVIGYSGNTGKSTGPHLHFEVRGAKNPF